MSNDKGIILTTRQRKEREEWLRNCAIWKAEEEALKAKQAEFLAKLKPDWADLFKKSLDKHKVK